MQQQNMVNIIVNNPQEVVNVLNTLNALSSIDQPTIHALPQQFHSNGNIIATISPINPQLNNTQSMFFMQSVTDRSDATSDSLRKNRRYSPQQNRISSIKINHSNHKRNTFRRKPSCKCSVCFKSFPSEVLRIIHEKIHNSEPYVCTICNSSFTSQLDQSNHMKISHPMVWKTMTRRHIKTENR
eukprot:234912_1